MSYMQQVQLLQQEEVNTPDPREQWNKDMLQFVKTIPKDNKVLLEGYMNGTLENGDIRNFLAEAGLYGLMTSKHSRNTPPTYIRGRQTIDHILGTPGMLNTVEAIAMVEFL
eukprot:486571-Ditylum_brightwellii.AAC.1